MNFWKMFSASILAWIVGIVGVCFIAVGSLMGIALSLNSSDTVIKGDSILYIHVNSNITDAPMSSPMGGFDPMSLSVSESVTLLNVLSAIEHAATDANIKGICIYTDGVGSISGANIEELRGALTRFKNSGKFIVAYDYNYTQSDYYLASVADKIVINPEGSLEWQGISSQVIFFKGLFDKLGVNVEVFRPTSCKYKSAVEPFILTKMSDANRKQNKEMIDAVWHSMCEDIAACRNISVDTIKEYAANLTASFPDDALKAGMVDAVAHEDYMFELFDGYGVTRNDSGLFNTIDLES